MHGMRGVGGVCEMGICLARCGVGEGVRGLGLGLTNPVGTGGVFDLCLCLGCGGYGLGTGSLRVGSCYVCVSCESGFFIYMAGPGICILC